MWKFLIVSVVLMHLGEAQRSSYAGRPGSKSKLLAKFKKENADSGLETRGGEENESTTLGSELQGTLEDREFVHRVSQWPQDRQPFWFKNRQAISFMRGRETDGGNFMSTSFDNNQRPRPQFHSPFQGPGRGRGWGVGRNKGKNEALSTSDDYYYKEFENDPSIKYLKR